MNECFQKGLRLKKIKKVAGAVGFEPTNAGSKSRCLTEKRMKNGGLLGFIFLEF